MEGKMGEYNKMFEAWFSKQFKDKESLLKTEKDGSYKDEMVNAMFLGFAAGWNLRSL